MNAITLPVIHSNGDSAETLLDGYREAMAAVSDAIEKTCATFPNARNFYVAGDAAFPAARREHQARLERLEAVREEVEALAMHCAQFVK